MRSDLGDTILKIDSDPNAEGFYQGMGARRIGEVLSEIEGKPHVLPRPALDLKDRSPSIPRSGSAVGQSAS